MHRLNCLTLIPLSIVLWSGQPISANPHNVKPNEQSATSEKQYANKGILELLGSASFSYLAYANNMTQINFDSMAGLNYFLLDNWFLGFAPGINYSAYLSGVTGKNPSLSLYPFFNLGYATPLSDRWYWFASVAYTSFFSTYDTLDNLKFAAHSPGLRTGLKYNVNHGLINVGLTLYKQFASDASGPTVFATFFGYSVFY